MEIVQRKPEDMTSEELIKQITDEINKHILDHLLGRNTEDSKYQKYIDKFDIVTPGRNTIPYNVRLFIEKLIDKDIELGYIEHHFRTNEGKIIHYKIDLDDLHSITYIYEKDIAPDEVFRMHQTEAEYHKSKEILEPVYAPYILESNVSTIGNYIYQSKYYISNDNS